MLAAFRMVDRDQLFSSSGDTLRRGVGPCDSPCGDFHFRGILHRHWCFPLLCFVYAAPGANGPVDDHARRNHSRTRTGRRSTGQDARSCPGRRAVFGGSPELEKLLNSIIRAADQPVRVVVLALSHARNPDAAFLKLLKTFHGRLQSQDVLLLLCGVQVDLRKALTASGLDKIIGPRHIISDSAGHGSSALEAVRLGNEVIAKDV